MRLTVALIVIVGAVCAAAQEGPLPLIPQPSQVQRADGHVQLTAETALVADGAPGESCDFLRMLLAPATGFSFPAAASAEGRPAIVLRIDSALEHLGSEGYRLDVAPAGITLAASTPTGLLYASQTLRQLLPAQIESSEPVPGVAWTVPCVQIEDTPRFGWRSCMLDSARHFQDKAFVKRFIDLLASYKMNRLHWHLADDQGWRVEIDARPRLAQVSARRPNANARLNYLPKEPSDNYGGCHSKDDLREIIAYAAARGIMIVPEIEMPGHCLAALMAYPELSCTGQPEILGEQWIYPDVFCAGNDETFEFIEAVLAEVVELFPSPWIHIGGDECPKTRWKACPKCQARMKAEGLATEDELQSYFVRRAEAILEKHGRRLIGWDEILEGGLAPRATVQLWRSMDGGLAAANLGHDVVMSPTSHCYLDYNYETTPVSKTYSFEPLPAELEPAKIKHILGVECCMWLGQVSRRHLEATGEILPPSGIFYQVCPRMIALSEVGWSPQNTRDWADFAARLKAHGERLNLRDINYFRDPAVWPEE
ncbi:MAG TPA: beta-N-acetylhexosaminidase [Candidatus Hydrogenedentes bacterium]|jgi:hexosaminidase|nr:beta-N-acetylhexosaminidase [Candidatus Hydrogenedentota bacterium]HPJ97928.1 beta-N-acetylhexosaminidase [Candidatus Hydrogenedentota bacterium]